MNLPIQAREQSDGTWDIAGCEYAEFYKCSHVASGLTKEDAETIVHLCNKYGEG